MGSYSIWKDLIFERETIKINFGVHTEILDVHLGYLFNVLIKKNI